METSFTMAIDGWASGDPIPARYAFGRPGTDAPFAPADNISPAIRWFNAPAATRSFALLCVDPDVPASAEDVNQEGKTVPADLPRMDFFHWVLIDIPAHRSGLVEGEASRGITVKGKPVGSREYGRVGKNDYTAWFSGDPEMEGVYGDYDGPCPPWNDSVIHHYHFKLFALDVATLPLHGTFGGSEALAAMEGHILAQASHVGTYSMNPAVGL